MAQALTFVVGAVAVAAAFTFSLALFAVLAVAGTVFWLYFRWKTRALRRHIDAQMKQPQPGPRARTAGQAGEIIEGEAVRVVEDRERLAG